MKDLQGCIEDLQKKLEKNKRENLGETATRTIFIDPLLQALGWDVTNPEEVQLEYPTVGGGFVDYAPKLNREPVLLIEAKGLNDSLNDKAISQVVAYAASDGIEWCILTNGIDYKVYKSTENVKAPEKLLYEVSIDPKDAGERTIKEVVELLNRFSKESMIDKVLDEYGKLVFTTSKIRKAVDILFNDPPSNLIKMIRTKANDEKIKPQEIKDALKRLWAQTTEEASGGVEHRYSSDTDTAEDNQEPIKRTSAYNEKTHTDGIPQEVVELYRVIDKFCREIDSVNVQRIFQAKSINYLIGKNIFCSVHITKSGLRIWLKLIYSRLDDPPANVRDVSNVGHWGAGDVEVAVNNQEHLKAAKLYISDSFDHCRD
jgi:hypothetical protein